ncbi:MAG: response regulator, partial [Blastocatellia bacterium]
MKRDESEAKSSREKPLRLLVIEDERTDYDLYLRQLTKAELRFESDLVQTREEFLASLRKKEYDIVLADYRLGDWTGMDALQLMREKGNHTPFILLSGVLGDELAVDCIKQGASDYVLKS